MPQVDRRCAYEDPHAPRDHRRSSTARSRSSAAASLGAANAELSGPQAGEHYKQIAVDDASVAYEAADCTNMCYPWSNEAITRHSEFEGAAFCSRGRKHRVITALADEFAPMFVAPVQSVCTTRQVRNRLLILCWNM